MERGCSGGGSGLRGDWLGDPTELGTLTLSVTARRLSMGQERLEGSV